MALTVPAHKYSVFTHVGPMDRVQDTYNQIFTWLCENGYQKEEMAFSLESYDERYNPATDNHNTPTNAFDIYSWSYIAVLHRMSWMGCKLESLTIHLCCVSPLLFLWSKRVA